MAEEHRDAVQGVVLRREDEGLADAVPVEGRVQDGFGKVAVGVKVRPLALALETAQDGVVAQGFLPEAQFLELGIALQEVADDQGHLHDEGPVRVLLLPGLLEVGPVADVVVFLAVGLRPGEGLLEFLVVVDAPVHAADDLHLVDAFAAHSKVVLEEVRIHDGAGDAHADGADGQVRLAPHGGGSDGGAGEAEEFLLDVRRNDLVIRVLHVVAVDAEGGQALLRVRGEDGGEVHRARPLRAVEPPNGLDRMRVHVHGLADVAPARGDRDRDGDAFADELLSTGGGFGHAADGGIGDDTLDGGAVRVAEPAGQEGGDTARHAHGLVFQGFADAVHAAVDGRADADFGVVMHSSWFWLFGLIRKIGIIRRKYNLCIR